MLHKSFKAVDLQADPDQGTFTATVAVFGNVDLGGDRIIPGAFAKTLAKWHADGDPIPVILSHSWDDPFHHIGVVEDAKETAGGLLVKGRLDVEDNDVARQVHRLMQRRSLKEFSFGYQVPAGGSKRAKDGANELREIELVEVGPTLKGMNPATELHEVKSALGIEDGPPPLEEQREDAKRKAREVEQALKIPDDIPEGAATVVLEEPPAPEPVPVVIPPPVTEQQRAHARRIEREIEAIALEDVPKSAPVVILEPAPEPSVDGIVTAIEQLRETERDAIKAALGVETPRPPGELRKAAERTAREVEQTLIPDDVPDAPKAPDDDPGAELQEVKQQLAEVRASLEDLKKKADEATKEPKRARVVDPLRKQADAVALEVATGDHLPTPPQILAPPPREPELSLRDLKARMHQENLEAARSLFSGGLSEES